MDLPNSAQRRRTRWIPAALVGLAGAIFGVQVGTSAVFVGLGGMWAFETSLGIVLTGLFSLVVVVGVLWHRRRGIPPERYPRMGAWVVGFGVLVLLLNLVMIAAWTTGTFFEDLTWAIQAAAMGCAAGTIFGSIEARAISRAVDAERAAMRSEQLEDQREWLEYLNGLLRHEVLNTTNVIVGYAELLIEEHEGDERTRDFLERVARQSRKMTDVIQDVRLLIRATGDDDRLEPIDVVPLLGDEVRALRDRHGEASVTASMPESAVVVADELLSRVFANVLENAVLHNDAKVPSIEVAVRADEETVTVAIEDNGPGVPEDEHETLFDQSGRGDHGLGLYLVRTLLSRYGASIDLAETGPDGSVFAIELPRVTAEEPTAQEWAAATPKAA